MGTRVLLLVLLGACWRTSEPPRIETPHVVGVHCEDLTLRGARPNPSDDAFVAKQWSDVITEGVPTGSDVDVMRAHFRVSWAHAKLGEWRGATLSLEHALELAERPARRTRLESRFDMLVCLFGLFSTEPTITPEGIRDYLIAIGGERYADDVLVFLARTYVVSGRTLAADRVSSVRPQPRSRRR